MTLRNGDYEIHGDSITDLIMPSDAAKLIGTDDYCEIEVFVRRKVGETD